MKRFYLHLSLFCFSAFLSLLLNFISPSPANSQSQIVPAAAGAAAGLVEQIVSNPQTWSWLNCLASSLPSSSSTVEKDNWGLPVLLRTRFPLDLVYPLSPNSLVSNGQCLKTSLWGVSRDMCTPLQLTKIIKNAFLLKFVISSLFHL